MGLVISLQVMRSEFIEGIRARVRGGSKCGGLLGSRSSSSSGSISRKLG
jgi:hypothetical protein